MLLVRPLNLDANSQACSIYYRGIIVSLGLTNKIITNRMIKVRIMKITTIKLINKIMSHNIIKRHEYHKIMINKNMLKRL